MKASRPVNVTPSIIQLPASLRLSLTQNRKAIGVKFGQDTAAVASESHRPIKTTYMYEGYKKLISFSRARSCQRSKVKTVTHVIVS